MKDVVAAKNMIDLADFFGSAATICTIGLFLSGSEICYRIIKTNKNEDISSMPFLTAFVNCILWFLYGLLIKNMQIILVNAVGFNLEAVYIIIYLYYTQNKKKMFHQILFVLTIAISAFSYAFLIADETNTAAKVFGYLGSLASILMFGSPLTSIKNVMKTQSTESLSFLLCLANFACSSLWAIYGSLIHDGFVIVPNLVGSILGFTQISLFAKFPSKSLATRCKLKSDDPII